MIWRLFDLNISVSGMQCERDPLVFGKENHILAHPAFPVHFTLAYLQRECSRCTENFKETANSKYSRGEKSSKFTKLPFLEVLCEFNCF